MLDQSIMTTKFFSSTIKGGSHMKKIFALMTAGALALSLSACQASSQQTTDTTTKSADSTDTAAAKNDGSFPSETITLVCPFSAGGGTDIGARNLAQALSKVMGVNVVVENQTGSGGWVAWTDLIQGDYKDGYTIGLINHNYAMGELDPDNPRKYNLDDVTVLANQALDYNVMAIRSNDTRFSDIDSFIEYAKSNPVLVSAQAAGITDGDATTAEWFNKTFGTQITVVPVDGASDSRGMFLSGDTDIFFASISDVMASYQSGEMKVACIFSDERSDFIPDVPTIKEATGEDFVAFAARGYFYPNGVPQDIVDTTTDALLKAMEDPDYIENMAALGLQLDNTSGEDFKELLESQVETRKMIWNVQ